MTLVMTVIPLNLAEVYLKYNILPHHSDIDASDRSIELLTLTLKYFTMLVTIIFPLL